MGLSNFVGPPGSVGLNFRGTWTATPTSPSTYNLRDGVRRANSITPQNGGLFICGANGITSDPLIDGANWTLVSADGATGATGAPGALTLGLDGTHAAAGNDSRFLSSVPALQNFLAWTHDPMSIVQNTGTSGVLYLVKLALPSPMTITNAHMALNVAGTGYTYWAMGLYSTTGATLNLLASSADLHTTVTTGFNTFPMGTPLSWAGGAGATLYVGVLGVYTTAFFAAMNNTAFANLNCAAGAGLRNSRISGLATLPATITAASLVGPNVLPWMAIS